MRRTQKATSHRWWSRSRKAIILEVKELRQCLRERFAERRNTLPADWILFNAAVDTVEAFSEIFPTSVHPVPLHRFFSLEPLSLRNLIAGALTPQLFTDELIGSATN